MKGVAIASGVFAASSVAGPVIIVLAAAASAFRSDFELQLLPALPLIAFAAMPFGIPLTILPTWLGAVLLGKLGVTDAWARWPVAWAFGGAAIGALCFGSRVEHQSPGFPDFAHHNLAAYGLAGAMCGLLGRWRTRWHDELSYTPSPG